MKDEKLELLRDYIVKVVRKKYSGAVRKKSRKPLDSSSLTS